MLFECKSTFFGQKKHGKGREVDYKPGRISHDASSTGCIGRLWEPLILTARTEAEIQSLSLLDQGAAIAGNLRKSNLRKNWPEVKCQPAQEKAPPSVPPVDPHNPRPFVLTEAAPPTAAFKTLLTSGAILRSLRNPATCEGR